MSHPKDQWCNMVFSAEDALILQEAVYEEYKKMYNSGETSKTKKLLEIFLTIKKHTDLT